MLLYIMQTLYIVKHSFWLLNTTDDTWASKAVYYQFLVVVLAVAAVPHIVHVAPRLLTQQTLRLRTVNTQQLPLCQSTQLALTLQHCTKKRPIDVTFLKLIATSLRHVTV